VNVINSINYFRKKKLFMKKLQLTIASVFLILMIGFNNSYSGPRNVLIEYITGTWCGNCPCGHQTLNTISSMYPQTIIIAYHAFSNDPWRTFQGNEIVNLFGFSVTPTSDIDRQNVVSLNDYSQWITGVQTRYANSPNTDIDLAITSKTYNESTRELNITIDAVALENLTGQYKINFVITENNLIYQQNFYSQCGPPGYVTDYVHNHVTRTILNGASGEDLNMNNVWNMSHTISKSVSAVLDANWAVSNCKIIAFVYKYNSNLALANVEQALESSVMGTSGISGNSNEVPEQYYLSQNYPNPFNPVTNIKFSLPKDGVTTFKVFDIFGKEVENYVDGFLQKGTYNVEFDGTNLSSGIYFYVLRSGSYFDKKKMILVK
jgi:Outer membrane protein Omp28/Secretion system C-terminal sorting domain